MKKQKRILTVIFGLCAVIWVINAVIGIVEKEYLDKGSNFIFYAVMAVAWIVIFILHVVQYRKMPKDE
ncbi:MAG: hypothetical protein J6X08_02040 [Lachnospiraceae bacterium]|nr:hypothetical protein [Lachnospiraceae bacterium]